MNIYLLALFLVSSKFAVSTARTIQQDTNNIPEHDATVVYKWVNIGYKRPANLSTHKFKMTYPYDYRNIVLSGIKVYKGEVYVTVPRISPGVPATLARVIEQDGEAMLDAFPNWQWQEIGNCDYLQTVNNIEIDPKKGWLWIIDTGRIHTFYGGLRNLCKPKLIIYDLNNGEVIIKYEFPDDVASITKTFLSDIVIDPDLNHAYIPNTVEGKLIFFSLNDTFSLALDHPLFKFEKGNNSIEIDGITGKFAEVSSNIDGIAMSPRRDYIIYSLLGGYGLYMIPTEFFKQLIYDHSAAYVKTLDHYVARVGYKLAHSRGLVMGHDSVYYGGHELSGVYRWNIADLLSYPQHTERMVSRTPQLLVATDERMKWIGTVTLDTEGTLWMTSSNMIRYFNDMMDYHDTYNYFIWKVPLNETSYLQRKVAPLPSFSTEIPDTTSTTTGSTIHGMNSNETQISAAESSRVNSILLCAKLISYCIAFLFI